MSSRRKNAANVLSLSLLLVIPLSQSRFVIAVHAQAQAQDGDTKIKRAVKISPLLERGRYASQERVSVIIELVAPISAPLKAFLNQSAVHPGRNMKTLGSFAVTLPIDMVSELACFPEVFHVSLNEVVDSFGHVSATTGADAGRSAAARPPPRNAHHTSVWTRSASPWNRRCPCRIRARSATDA